MRIFTENQKVYSEARLDLFQMAWERVARKHNLNSYVVVSDESEADEPLEFRVEMKNGYALSTEEARFQADILEEVILYAETLNNNIFYIDYTLEEKEIYKNGAKYLEEEIYFIERNLGL